MKGPDKLDWGKLVRIDSKWIDDYLLDHKSLLKGKITVRAYSIRFAGTEEHMQSLVEFMTNSIEHFVLTKAEIKEFKEKGQIPWREAARFFTGIDPQKDGKYGELLLFLMVEAILRIPMIAHKIKAISDDPMDQVKGSDCVFFGVYRKLDSLLLGEAKIYQNRNGAVTDALASVNKFYDGSSAYGEMKNELYVINQTLARSDLSLHQLKFLERVLDLQSEQYRKTNKVHPILIVYDDCEIPKIEKDCKDSVHGDAMAHTRFGKLTKEMLSIVNSKINSNLHSLGKVYLDFFFMPVSDVRKFRASLFKAIHGVDYTKKDEK